MTKMERRAAAAALLTEAQAVLGMDDQRFAAHLMEEANAIAPELFTAIEGEDDDGVLEGAAVH
ncbi:hypothetical protein [Roseixanthobacter glucoisosaccharinicivorans]|uniref:hypothetical protein n=1 Tax=Roseixanthobacter glucoisosaccharinicivorans TaxID=3119923 RepID=UPI00372C5D7D